jgi:hypothetical protein
MMKNPACMQFLHYSYTRLQNSCTYSCEAEHLSHHIIASLHPPFNKPFDSPGIIQRSTIISTQQVTHITFASCFLILAMESDSRFLASS